MRGRALLGAAVLLGLAAAARAEDEAAKPRAVPSITVEGRASVPAVPDIVVISAGVVTERPHAADAAAQNNKIAQGLIAAVTAAGIEARDVQTTAVQLEPVYDEPANAPRRLTGFRASLTLQVRVRVLDKAAPLVGILTDKGANSIDGVDFVVSPDPQRDDQLRADAMRDARHGAEVYVGALGLKLGRVLEIAPGDSGGEEPRRFLHVYRRKAAEAPPLAAGTQDQTAKVSVTFEILQQ